jgi:hypothetical protein
LSAPRKQAGPLQAFKAVAWSFFGVRKGTDHEADVEKLNPVHVIIAGLVMAGLFVFTLIQIVGWVTSS